MSKKNAKPQPEEIIKCSHLSLHIMLHTMDPSLCFPVFIPYQTPVPELSQLFVIPTDARLTMILSFFSFS